MLSDYLHKTLEREYHNISLWYFASFTFGIIYLFQIGLSIHAAKIFFIFLSLFALSGMCYRKSLSLFFLACLCCSFVFGVLVAKIRVENIETRPITKVIATEILGNIEGIKPTLHGRQLTISNITSEGGESLNKVRINVSSKLYSDINKGDRVKLRAKLFPLQAGVLPGTYDFGFYMYMSGIEATGYALTAPEVINRKKGFWNEYIQLLRQKIYTRLISVLGEESGNFAAAILIGETKAIPKTMAENMRNSGIAHILSVSGLHLSLVAMLFFVSSRFLLNCSNYIAYNFDVKLIAALISIVGSFFYLQISGSNIAATRAFIMTSIFILAIILGRSPYPMRSVMIAAFLILLFLPEYVLHPSFQLSFAAVLCLISGYELYIKNKHLLGNSKGIFASIKFYVFANIYSSFLASIVTAPYVIYHFYKFATYSVLMNLIAVPLMSFFMMPLALLSLLSMPLGIDGPTLSALGFFISIVTDSASYIVGLPGAVWITGSITPLSLLVFTFGFFWICFWQTGIRFLGVMIMLSSIVMMCINPRPDFIYDHTLKAVGLKNQQGELEIFESKNMPKFTLDYWTSWYGQKSVRQEQRNIAASDQIFELGNGKKVSLNYWKCSDADVQIITSKKLKCTEDRGQQIINNSDLWRHRQILLYCKERDSSCRVELGNQNRW